MTQQVRPLKRQDRVIQYTSPRFPIILAVISHIYDALIVGKSISKREIYYRDVKLFKSQKVVDEVIDQIQQTLNVPRHAMNVEAAAKGLVRGPLTIITKTGRIDCRFQDHLIHKVDEYLDVEIGVTSILVVEKEAVFKDLSGGEYVLVTGKGYPDIATRQFLSFLKRCLERSTSPAIRETPFLALVDYDPHGIEILATYRFGSASQSSQSERLSLNCLKWLGVHQSDFMKTPAKLMQFSAQDEKKMNALMEKTWLAATNDAGTWKQELERMQERKVKAEIEVMSHVAGGVKQFVAEKLARLAWL